MRFCGWCALESLNGAKGSAAISLGERAIK